MDKITDLDVYPESEKVLLEKLLALFNESYDYAKGIHFIKSEYSYDDLLTDGFFPFYTKQKTKVLFIGWETYDFWDQNYIDYLYQNYKSGKYNNKQFAYLMYYITYGILNGFPDWFSIPSLCDTKNSFATEDGLSFAFINLSKFNNETGSANADSVLINDFVKVFSNPEINLYERQIAILDPDIIISMNLEQNIEKLGKTACINYTCNNICVYEYIIQNNKKIPLFDTRHFSARGANDIYDYYLPIKEAYVKYKSVD